MKNNLKSKRYKYDELKNLRSEYLDSGFRKDHYEIEYIEIGEDFILGNVHFTDYYMPSDEHFHLSILWATTICMQLAIIYSCVSNQCEKEKEVYLRELKWKCSKPINSLKNLKFKIYNIKMKRRGNRLYYYSDINIDDNKFSGEGSWIFDL